MKRRRMRTMKMRKMKTMKKNREARKRTWNRKRVGRREGGVEG